MTQRAADQCRKIKITRNFTRFAEGSVLYEQGQTRVLCNASVETRLPSFLRGSGRGWVTAEYSMLPRSTSTRSQRESQRGKLNGRGVEISRLIGRSLRAAVDMEALGEASITVDCDVLQADGGTRCASITGGMIALYDALRWMKKQKMIETLPLRYMVGAISVGIVDGKPVLDLDYELDSSADVDLNVVMTANHRFIELQGTAEREPFTDRQLTQMKRLATKGIDELVAAQKKALKIK